MQHYTREHLNAAGPHYGAAGVTAMRWDGAPLLSLHHPAPFLAPPNLLTVSFSEAINRRILDVTHQLPPQPETCLYNREHRDNGGDGVW